MDEMTQENAALVEEVSASAANLGHQSGELRDLVSFFHLGEADVANTDQEIHPVAPRVRKSASAATSSAAPEEHMMPVIQKRMAAEDEWEEF